MPAQRSRKTIKIVSALAVIALLIGMKLWPFAVSVLALVPLLLYAAWHYWFSGGRAARLAQNKAQNNAQAEHSEARLALAAARGWRYNAHPRNGNPRGLTQYEFSGVKWRLWLEQRTDPDLASEGPSDAGAIGIFRQTYEPPINAGLVFVAELTVPARDEWVLVSVPSPNREYLRQALASGYQPPSHNTPFWSNWLGLPHWAKGRFCSQSLLIQTGSEVFDRHFTLYSRNPRCADWVTPELATLLADFDLQSRKDAKDAGYRYENFNVQQRELELCAQLACPDPTHEQIERLAVLGIALAERSRWVMVNRAV
jgi:hypothetical protein